ncbi:uncharacterized protein LOC142336701 [Convolutriloba macropyga]|uniref:uncharacterized protein LOC142336701 n=1 Tax=Convolutriloba macropyga TaxID=536237 RepID=UPI003F51E7F6
MGPPIPGYQGTPPSVNWDHHHGSMWDHSAPGIRDKDECDPPWPVCGWGKGTCDNSLFPYTCNCKDGYELANRNNFYGPYCKDIDECEDASKCGGADMGECNNEEGSYSCTCKPGAEPDSDFVTCEGEKQT